MQFEFRSSSAMLITFFAGVLDLREGTFTYANAGHCHPFLVIPGSVTELPVSGSAIGFSQKVLHTERKLDVRPGSTLVLYTDGLTEVGKGVPLQPVLQKVLPGPDFHRRLLEVVLETAGTTAYTDDVTILTAKLN
jgi:sigma-B regulation protein RsbU (phosphoserine phosphatase)